MRKGRWLLYLWPGLPELWQHGTWSALALACGFAGLLNLALAVSLVWTAWLSPELRFGLWTAVLAFSVFGAWQSHRQAGQPVSRPVDLFSRATGEYLQGNWFEAEGLLTQLLGQDRQDIDAHLMLATLFRHTTRHDEARQALNRLVRLEGAEKWSLEIQRELQLLDRAAQSADESDSLPDTLSMADGQAKVEAANLSELPASTAARAA